MWPCDSVNLFILCLICHLHGPRVLDHQFLLPAELPDLAQPCWHETIKPSNGQALADELKSRPGGITLDSGFCSFLFTALGCSEHTHYGEVQCPWNLLQYIFQLLNQNKLENHVHVRDRQDDQFASAATWLQTQYCIPWKCSPIEPSYI